MNDFRICSKKDCGDIAVVVAGGLCFKHIKVALFGGKD